MADPSAFIARAREVIAKATPGPWAVCPMAEYVMARGGQVNVLQARGWGYLTHAFDEEGAEAVQRANLQLTALAVNALPALVAVAEAAANFQKAMRHYRDDGGYHAYRALLDAHSALAPALAALAEVPGE